MPHDQEENTVEYGRITKMDLSKGISIKPLSEVLSKSKKHKKCYEPSVRDEGEKQMEYQPRALIYDNQEDEHGGVRRKPGTTRVSDGESLKRLSAQSARSMKTHNGMEEYKTASEETEHEPARIRACR